MFQRIDRARVFSELEMQHGFACIARASDLCDRLPSLDAIASFDEIFAVVAVGGQVSVGVSHKDEITEALERRAAVDDDAVFRRADDIAFFGSDVDTVVALSEAFFAEATDHLSFDRSKKVFAFALRCFRQSSLFGGYFCRASCLSGGGGSRLLSGGLA